MTPDTSTAAAEVNADADALLVHAPLAARPAITGAVWLRLPLLSPSPTNPRKVFKAQAMEELTTSLRQHGQIAPILARPSPAYAEGNGHAPYEIVAGERRWRAAGSAGMTEIMTIVRDMSDFEVLEVQVIENLQRDDLHPLEEAEGYHQLLRQPGGTEGYASADELAARIGKSRSYVYQRLKLCDLCPEAREAFGGGQLATSVAVLIARMPVADQPEATAKIVQGFGGEPYTYRSAAEYLQRTFMLRLDRAPFDINALYADTVPCGQCSKRSGAHPGLFEDVADADMCQDRRCFEEKTEAAHQATLQAARDAGHTVLSGDEARAILPVPSGAPVGYHFMDKPCPALTDSKRNLRDLLGLNFKGVVVLDHPVTETAIAVAPTDKVKRALKAKGVLREEAPAAAQGKAKTKPDPSPELATALSPTAQPSAPARAGEHELDPQAESLRYCAGLFALLHQTLNEGELPLAGLRLALGELLYGTSSEATALIYSAHGWPMPTDMPLMEDLRTRLATASARLLGQLLIEVTVCEDCTCGAPLEELQDTPPFELARELGLDLQPLLAGSQDPADANQSATAAFLNSTDGAPA